MPKSKRWEIKRDFDRAVKKLTEANDIVYHYFLVYRGVNTEICKKLWGQCVRLLRIIEILQEIRNEI